MSNVKLAPGRGFLENVSGTDVGDMLYHGFIGDLIIEGLMGKHSETQTPILLFATRLIEIFAKTRLLGDIPLDIPVIGTERFFKLSYESEGLVIESIGEVSGGLRPLGCHISEDSVRRLMGDVVNIFRAYRDDIALHRHYLAQNWILDSALRRVGLR